MRINPYLSFDQQCREAFEFYAKTFHGKIAMIMSQGESPMAAELPAASRDAIMHAELHVGDQVLMGADAAEGCGPARSNGCVTITVDSSGEAERLFAALSEGGSVFMPMAETFWAQRFGMATDRFGTPWMINCLKSMS